MKYYYLVNGKLMWATSKMPKIIDHIQSSESIDNYLIVWRSSLQPCSITDVEFQKILAYLEWKTLESNPIEVTDIVEESIKKCDCCIIDCLPTRCLNPKVILVFKQPKSEANEAVESQEWLLTDLISMVNADFTKEDILNQFTITKNKK